MPGNKSQILIGTSGWNYKHWIGNFYPEDISQSDLLSYYSQKFKTVEINSTFYNLPSEETVVQWKNSVPDDFIFSVKASRYITHMKKLKDPKSSLRKFMTRIVLLDQKLGPILFQLPPNWKFNFDRLQSFINSLSPEHTYIFEFRNHSWINQDSLQLLKDHNITFCIYELNGFITPKELTSDTVYIRLHGTGSAYEGSYTKKLLMPWRGFIGEQHHKKRNVFCYFNNDAQGFAPKNALTLIDMDQIPKD